MTQSRTSSLYSIVRGLRYLGVGAKVTRSIYRFPETYWIVSKVNLTSEDGLHGKAWGRLVWRGVAKPKDEKITTALKPQWKLIDLPDYRSFRPTHEQIKERYSTAKPYVIQPKKEKVVKAAADSVKATI